MWLCKCACGNITKVQSSNLLNGHTKSCGCVAIEKRRGQRKHNIYDLSGDFGIGYTNNTSPDGENYFYFDLSDYEKIKEYSWHFGKDYYIKTDFRRNGVKKSVLLHRFILNAPSNMYVDHINHKPNDNRRNNLRLVTCSQNMMNTKIRIDSGLGIKGVHFNEKTNNYSPYISINNKRIHLGTYSILEDAIAARKEAEEKYFGEYSYANSVDDSKEEGAE